MTNRSFPSSDRTQPAHACCDVCAPDCGEETVISASERDLIKDGAGSVLVTLGAMFAKSPVFREHIDAATANMLVSLGKKLKRK